MLGQAPFFFLDVPVPLVWRSTYSYVSIVLVAKTYPCMGSIFIFFTFSLLSSALHFKLTISFFSTSVILEVSPVAKILLELFLVAEPAGRLRAYAIS